LPKVSGHLVAIDTETTGLKWYKDHIIGVSIECPTAGIHGFIHCKDERRRQWVYEEANKIERKTEVIMHNAKFDLHMLNTDPDALDWQIYDVPVMLSNIDSRPMNSRALDRAEKTWLGSESKRDHIFSSGGPKNKPWLWDDEPLADYGYNDALVTFQLYEKLKPTLEYLQLWKLFKKDMNFLKVIWRAERHGILVDLDYIADSVPKQAQHVEVFEQDLWDACGYEFNWRSPWQLSDAIYGNLGIPKPKNPFADADGVDRSKLADKGLYKSTCTSIFLLREKVHHPLANVIGDLREAYRMLRTLEGYAELVDDEGRAHANFKQARTRTHRLSCGDPNLQNVPSKVRGRFTQGVYSGDTERLEEYNLRTAFRARPGYELLSVDYKQMEMRKFGILAKDQGMLDTLASGADIHAYVAERTWGEVNKVYREWSKTIGFGLIYGMTVGSLMFKLNKSKAQASKIQKDYLRAFPRILPFMNEVIEECARAKMVRYWDGKIWREDNPKYFYRAVNAKIQGGCAEILSIAGIRVDKWCKQQGSDHRIVSFVHDELMLEVPKDDVVRTAKEVGAIMEVPDLFEIPFLTDGKSGPTYGSQEKLFGKASYETAKETEKSS
jgi:DNA polymerase-1